MTVVIGTAGHIDHGKTALLRALTGIDADRLPEERARGMTIDVGYAHLVLDDGSELDFVDVPGHDRLVGNMLVGAGEIDAALVVVAADDGPRAQTREHLQLLDALTISRGLAVVTKTDVVPSDRVDAAMSEVRALLAATSLAGAPVVAASSLTGDGVGDVREAVISLRDRVVAGGDGAIAERASGSRLAIDRVFSIRGRGTVVTGTLRGAPLERGAVLRVVPDAQDRTVRVREVQVHGHAVDSAGPGRVALALTGDAVAGLCRGLILTTDPMVGASDRLLVAIRSAVALGGERGRRPPETTLPSDRTRFTIHLGTAHVGAAVGRGPRDSFLLDGGEASAILRLDRPIAVAPGDRFAIRLPSPLETLGGGRVLDADPPRGVARRRASAARLGALAAALPGSDVWAAARLDLHGALTEPAALAADVADEVDAAITESAGAVEAARSSDVVRRGAVEVRKRAGGSVAVAERLATARLEAIIRGGGLIRDGDRVRPAGRATSEPPPELTEAMDRLVAILDAVAPPSLSAAAAQAGCPPDGIRALERANRIVRLDDDLAWAFPTYRDLAGRALAMAAIAPLTPAAYRDATGTSRKYVMAILEDLDRRAILRRTPAGHVPGPRAPSARE